MSDIFETGSNAEYAAALSRRGILGVASTVWASIACEALSCRAEGISDTSGLTVKGTGVYLNGKPYRGIGVNFYDALDHSNIREEFRKLRDLGIPYIRFDLGAFGPSDTTPRAWEHYFSNRSRWYGLRDDCIAAAEECGIGLIPSLFWSFGTIPKVLSLQHGVSENTASWLRPNSFTYQFIHDFTVDVILRYSKSSAIWGWELGDEFNNGTGRACNARNSNDAGADVTLSFTEVAEVYRAWGTLAKKCNAHSRLLSTGANLALDDIHACVVGAARRPDLFAEWMNVPAAVGTVPAPSFLNPRDSYNSICVHIYQETDVPNRWFRDRPRVGPAELIRVHKKIADEEGRVLFVGEFGSLSGTSGQDGRFGSDASDGGERAYFNEMLNAIVDSGTQLACAWNYGYLPNNPVKRWNMDSHGPRSYMLDEIAAANTKMLVEH